MQNSGLQCATAKTKSRNTQKCIVGVDNESVSLFFEDCDLDILDEKLEINY